MLKKLLKLASTFDKLSLYSLADEIDILTKKAIGLTPEREKEIDESVDKYFADPKNLEKDQIEKDYSLGVWDDDGIRSGIKSWQGHPYTYEGVPAGKESLFSRIGRYQTVIADHEELPEKIEDPMADVFGTIKPGTWKLKEIFDKPDGAAKGKYQAVYQFISDEELARIQERDKSLSPDIIRLLEEDDVETTEEPEDIVSVTEEKPSGEHGGGVKLF